MGKEPRAAGKHRDRAEQRLLDLAEALLDDVFMEDKASTAFDRARRRTRGKPVRLGARALSSGGNAAVMADPGSAMLRVELRHPDFQADIAADYEPEFAEMRQASLTTLTGDRKLASRLAKTWAEEIDSMILDDEDFDRAVMSFLTAGAAALDTDDDPVGALADAPPPATARDEADIRQLVGRLAREFRRQEPRMASVADDIIALEQRPQCLEPILAGLIEACAATRRDGAVIDAWRFLFAAQLTSIRYRIDRGWAWAQRMVEACQQQLIEAAQAGRLAGEDTGMIISAFGEARLTLTDETKAEFAHAASLSHAPEGLDPSGAMAALMDQMAEAVQNPFDLCAGLTEVSRPMPAEIRGFMAYEFAASSHATLREAVPLLLLSEEQAVRRAAAAALEQAASSERMSPETLRRMIAIRNWLPLADRPPLDQAIRKARVNGVVCAQWPAATALTIVATGIDGSGTSSVILSSPGNGKGTVAGLLFKLTTGVADSWCRPDTPRREIRSMIGSVHEAAETMTVGKPYLDRMVQHAIGAGVAANEPPSVILLQIAELAGGSDWQDRRIDIGAEAASLFAALPEADRSAEAIEAALERSGTWPENEAFAESWFLDDARTREVLAASRRDRTGNPVARLLTDVLPDHRAAWAERCVLMAIGLAAAQEARFRAMLSDFVIVAWALCGDRPLATIPLMRAIATQTVQMERLVRW